MPGDDGGICAVSGLDGVVIGGIYDDRLLLKKVSGLEQFGMAEAIPYEGGKAMWLVDCVDNAKRLGEIVGGWF